jgi:hypothetical protein
VRGEARNARRRWPITAAAIVIAPRVATKPLYV